MKGKKEPEESFHNREPFEEVEKYHDLKRFTKTDRMEYSASAMPANFYFSDDLKRHDKKLVSIANMAAQINHPIDATAHALARSGNTEDPAPFGYPCKCHRPNAPFSHVP
ncbi:hypothetical protein EDD11_006288 [Mortierella claussenii]|nr:hypothetical protein EDD11_006288 [Mortierella claussenii]